MSNKSLMIKELYFYSGAVSSACRLHVACNDVQMTQCSMWDEPLLLEIHPKLHLKPSSGTLRQFSFCNRPIRAWMQWTLRYFFFCFLFFFFFAINSLRPEQNGRHWVCRRRVQWKCWSVYLNFTGGCSLGLINNKSILGQILTNKNDKPIYNPMMTKIMTPYGDAMPQWVKEKKTLSWRRHQMETFSA